MTDLSADPTVPAEPAGGREEAARVQIRPGLDAAPALRPPQVFRGAEGEVALLPVTPDDFDQSGGASEEARALAAERASRREARLRALSGPESVVVAPPAAAVVARPSTDRFAGAFGLLLLRFVVAAILAVHGAQLVTDPTGAEVLFARTLLPQPGLWSLVTAVSELVIAAALVVGLLVRAAGVGVALIAAGALAFVEWGPWSPFVPGRPGFLGELELLLAVVGLVLLFVGAGGFSLDRAFRAARDRGRAARAAAGR